MSKTSNQGKVHTLVHTQPSLSDQELYKTMRHTSQIPVEHVTDTGVRTVGRFVLGVTELNVRSAGKLRFGRDNRLLCSQRETRAVATMFLVGDENTSMDRSLLAARSVRSDVLNDAQKQARSRSHRSCRPPSRIIILDRLSDVRERAVSCP